MGPNFFPVAGRFRFIQVLEILMLGILKVFRFMQVPFKTGFTMSVAAGEAAILRSCKRLCLLIQPLITFGQAYFLPSGIFIVLY